MGDGKYEIPKGCNPDNYDWTEPILGMVLIKFRGAIIDSYGNKMDDDTFYVIGKSKSGGQNIILPTDKNHREDFKNENINRRLKETGQLN